MISLRPSDTVCEPTEPKVANSWEMVRLKLPSSARTGHSRDSPVCLESRNFGRSHPAIVLQLTTNNKPLAQSKTATRRSPLSRLKLLTRLL